LGGPVRAMEMTTQILERAKIRAMEKVNSRDEFTAE